MIKKLSYQEINGALDAFGNDLAMAKLGWKLSLYVSRNIDHLSPHADHYNKANTEIILEHSVEKEIDEKIQRVVEPKNISQFQQDISKLLNVEVDIEYDELDFESLSAQEQEKVEEFMTPKILHNIKYIFKE